MPLNQFSGVSPGEWSGREHDLDDYGWTEKEDGDGRDQLGGRPTIYSMDVLDHPAESHLGHSFCFDLWL